MNSRQRATLRGIFADPIPADIQWSEIASLLRAAGAEISEGRGSRVRVVLNGVRQVFHRPHPRPEVSRMTVKDVRDFLTRSGVTP